MHHQLTADIPTHREEQTLADTRFPETENRREFMRNLTLRGATACAALSSLAMALTPEPPETSDRAKDYLRRFRSFSKLAGVPISIQKLSSMRNPRTRSSDAATFM